MEWLDEFNFVQARKFPCYHDMTPGTVLDSIDDEERLLKLVQDEKKKLQQAGLWEVPDDCGQQSFWARYEIRLRSFQKRLATLRVAKHRAQKKLGII
ncbi:unnamed protein product [Amoebophrya sp. A25]|nr:unnamed protein product [Amoebophrya sp. A25]|eukprot:GSA25T00019652001.1